jgi:hypothetical protein
MFKISTSKTTNSQTSSTHSKVLASITLLLLRLDLLLRIIVTTTRRTVIIVYRRRARRRRIITTLRLGGRNAARAIIVARIGRLGIRRLPLRAASGVLYPEGAAGAWLPFLVPAGWKWRWGSWWGAGAWWRGAVGTTFIGRSV